MRWWHIVLLTLGGVSVLIAAVDVWRLARTPRFGSFNHEWPPHRWLWAWALTTALVVFAWR
jgi:hypothetical protein